MTTFTYMVTLPAEKELDTHSRPGDGYSQIVASVFLMADGSLQSLVDRSIMNNSIKELIVDDVY